MAIRARTKLPLVLLLQRRLRVAKHQHPTLTMTTSRPDRFSRLSRATTVDLDSAAAEGSNLPPRLYRRSRLPLLLSHPRLFHPRQATRAHSLPLRGRILAASRRRAAAAAEEESISVRRWRRFASSLRQATTRLPLCRRRRRLPSYFAWKPSDSVLFSRPDPSTYRFFGHGKRRQHRPHLLRPPHRSPSDLFQTRPQLPRLSIREPPRRSSHRWTSSSRCEARRIEEGLEPEQHECAWVPAR
jgi:hypothetical protein